MGVSQERLAEFPSESQKVVIRFKTEEADLEAQEILWKMGKVHYVEGADGKERVIVTREMLKVLEEKHVPFERVTMPAPVSKTLRK
jgi:hypothetical protein